MWEYNNKVYDNLQTAGVEQNKDNHVGDAARRATVTGPNLLAHSSSSSALTGFFLAAIEFLTVSQLFSSPVIVKEKHALRRVARFLAAAFLPSTRFSDRKSVV